MNLRYGKILLYVLTFVGYVYSGYGSDFLSNLRDAVTSAETIFGGVLQNVIAVAKNFRDVYEVFDAAVDEECVFACPTGAPPRPRNHVPSVDGCGSMGVRIDSDYLPIGEMTECCDQHDICYDTCNKDKELCDAEFKRCLYKYCEGYEKVVGGSMMIKACRGAAKMLFTGTLTLGCKSYQNAQEKACYCPPSGYGWKDNNAYGWKDKKNREYARGEEL